jgi:hypothetical protein
MPEGKKLAIREFGTDFEGVKNEEFGAIDLDGKKGEKKWAKMNVNFAVGKSE